MNEQQETEGARIRRLRKKRGLTQAEFADLMGRSQPWVSALENDGDELDSVQLINRAASILRVHPNEITGRPYRSGSAEEDRGHAAIPAIRRALQRYDLPPDWPDPPRPYAELEAAVAGLRRLRRLARYADLGDAVPDVLREIHAAVDQAAGAEAERLHALRAAALKEADTVAHALGYDDLSTLATERIRLSAQSSGDPRLVAIADYLRVRDLWALNLWDDALTVIDRATGDLGGDADPATVSVIGSLQLRAAITAARSTNSLEAWARIDEAREQVAHTDIDPYGLTFTPANVDIHAVSVAVELQDGARAVYLHSCTQLPADTPPSRRGRYLLDVARGYIYYGGYDKALAAMEAAERQAPLLVQNNPVARAAVRALLTRERRSTHERLRRIANRMRIE